MVVQIDAEAFALSVISSTPAISSSPEAIAKEKFEQYLAAFKVAESYNENELRPFTIPPVISGSKKNS